MSTPKKGDLVDITIRGAEVLRVDDQRLYVYHDSSHLPAPAHFFLGGTNIEVEILPPPEPEWQPGDVVLDAGGRTYIYGGDEDWPWIGQDAGDPASADRYTMSKPSRPVTLLARNGKPVTSP